MSNVGRKGRSFERITRADLKRLCKLAQRDMESFFQRHPDWMRLYRRRILAIALCQGAALHYLHGKVGVHDFDVYTFFAEHPTRSWACYRRRGNADFGKPRFGTSPDAPNFVGRRVDLLSRSIEARPNADPADSIRRYLRSGSRNSTPWFLAQKAVVLLWPADRLGEVVWPAKVR
jgi:hypothetical protein